VHVHFPLMAKFFPISVLLFVMLFALVYGYPIVREGGGGGGGGGGEGERERERERERD